MKIAYGAALLLLAACNSGPGAGEKNQADSTGAAVPTPASQLQLEGTDGIELFFYPNPENRKTYRQLSITDTALVAALASNFTQDTVSRSECPHDIKMYLLKNGEVFKTVYGASKDSCRYFAYAINSRPFFTPMTGRSYQLLDSLRQGAK